MEKEKVHKITLNTPDQGEIDLSSSKQTEKNIDSDIEIFDQLQFL